MRMAKKFILAAEFPCEWKFATQLASDCECDGLVHSAEGNICRNHSSKPRFANPVWGVYFGCSVGEGSPP